jgi:hypothetical protein
MENKYLIIQELNIIFAAIANDTNKYPDNWKNYVITLNDVAQATDIFDDNAIDGFAYMSQVVFTKICDKCNDEKSFIWLKEFAKAWINKTNVDKLPQFPTSCFFNESPMFG